ncbi:hypothetical protein [Parerythrobacter lacustris]|uniref:DUF3784 domain-containing protein n=1 Tax=Parerythrobacter lacustris TaxID=2969984 RepID=A0ABT1XSA7_9SPHN|nr:hypothetical protein [Parerythrobacter lacustris]MCR2834492.1 hypothetical protein [Parerythrobacter lacustris]
MALVIIFLFGIGNFAVHRAVMESGHPLLGQIAFRAQGLGRRIAFVSELLILIAALALALNGYPAVVWAYGIYSLLNIGSAWLILTGRI